MTSLKEVFSETNGLYCRIDRIPKLSTYDEYDDLSGLEIKYKDREQLFMLSNYGYRISEISKETGTVLDPNTIRKELSQEDYSPHRLS